jgi:hypothetical protein
MPLLEILVFRLVAWVGLPLLLVVLVAGPTRVRGWFSAAWSWLFERRLEPGEVFDRVVRTHQAQVEALSAAIAQAEETQAELSKNATQSEKAVARLGRESNEAAITDDVEARAALYKLNLERMALESFRREAERLRVRVIEAKRRLYLLQLQLRQFEVGRSILLAQLAEARTVEQQYALANQFDPFNAVAEWRKAEGLVHDAARGAAAADRALADTAALPLAGPAPAIDPAALDAQMAELIASLKTKT